MKDFQTKEMVLRIDRTFRIGGIFLDNKVQVEICVDSIQSALAAQKAGADRIELCDNLIGGGTTPSAGMIELARKYLTMDINVIIRPRSGDFCYSYHEFEVMKKDIEIAKCYGANGIVIGILKPNGVIDVNMMNEIVQLSRPLTVTFHRAFDMTRDPFEALEVLINLGVERVLTSGQESKAIYGVELIKELVHRAEDKIIVMPGAGIDEINITDIIDNTGAKEIHMSAKKKVDSRMTYRNNKVAMGGNMIISEYDNYFTCEKTVRDVIEVLKKR